MWLMFQATVNYVCLHWVKPSMRPLSMAISTVSIHIFGDVPSSPLVEFFRLIKRDLYTVKICPFKELSRLNKKKKKSFLDCFGRKPEFRLDGLAHMVLQRYLCIMEEWFATDADTISLKYWGTVN